ncbi:hypothetical protein ACFW1D_24145 [Priestia megaterium]|uniref:hypothetical protein n=1 Tax=Priestia megaterium TaxID=1404 RepID=UPI0036706F51
MGSNGFSSDKKQNRVNLLKLLLDINLPTQGSSNPLETLLSGLDSGSLEDLLQKNKKSHHDDWDSKKKRHHDDCNDWDHKKKHDHDDCGCKKKKHDHDDWDHKKKHDHDDCGCKKKKHDHDDCGCKKKKHDHDDCGCKKKKHDHDDCCCKKKEHDHDDCCCEKKKRKRCKCKPGVKETICDLIEQIFEELEETGGADATDLRELLVALRNLLEDCSVPDKLLDELDRLIDELTPPPTTLPMDLLEDIEDFLEDLLKCLGLRRGECEGDGGIACGCMDPTRSTLCTAIANVLANITNTAPNSPLVGALTTLRNLLIAATCITGNVNPIIVHITNLLNAISSGNVNRIRAHVLIVLRDLTDLAACLKCGVGGTTPTTPLTLREQLLALVGETVSIIVSTNAFPTLRFTGLLATVEDDYLAIVNTIQGTILVPLDEIERWERV